MNNYQKTITLDTEVIAAVIMAIVAIDQAVDTGKLTSDIKEELEYLRPELQRFIDEA